MLDPGALWERWNIAVYLHLHATTDSPHWLIMLAAWLAEAPLLAALGLAAWQLFRRRDGRAAIQMAIAFAMALLIEAVISAVAFHPRPFAAGFGPAWVRHAANNSMPSTHVTLACIMALAFILRRQLRVGVVLLGLGAMLAWARIYVGIHWPADMVGAVISAGFSVAIAAGLVRLGMRFLSRHRPRGKDPISHSVGCPTASPASPSADVSKDR